jgi:hypothetical protein
MRKLQGTLVIAVLAIGCEAEAPEVPEIENPADTAEGCRVVGGRVVVDPGDGSGACAPGELVIGRPSGFIEGAYCCRPLVVTPPRLP